MDKMKPELLCIGEGLVELGLSEGQATVACGFGGDAANVAVMAARDGASTGLIGRVGADVLGRRAAAFWSAAGVDISALLSDDRAPTGIYVNELARDGTHRFDYHRTGSAGSRLCRGDVSAAAFAACRVLHLTGVTLAVSASSADAALEAARIARGNGALVSLGVNHRPRLDGDLDALRQVAGAADMIFLSDGEALELVGNDDPLQVREQLAPVAREIVLTRGADGAAAVVDGVLAAECSPPQVDAVDAAGAGDALAGAYLAARLAGLEAEPALARAVTAASLACLQRGCAASYPSAAEVDVALAGRAPTATG